MLVGWKVSALSTGVASIRYRALLPILGLREKGVEHKIFADSNEVKLDELDIVVIVKSFTADDYLLAQNAYRKNIPVILDICDNIFVKGYGESSRLKLLPAQFFNSVADCCSAVVVPTRALAEVVIKQMKGAASVHVIPDGLIKPDDATQIEAIVVDAKKNNATSSFLKEYRQRRSSESYLRGVRGWRLRLRECLRQVFGWWTSAKRVYRNCRKMLGNAKRGWEERPLRASFLNSRHRYDKKILWYGNHGAAYGNFGIQDLLAIQNSLEQIATEFDVELVVISNSYKKYCEHIKPIKIPSRYISWSQSAVLDEMRDASVVVVPNSLDEFSICKSPNRSVLALSSGVPVVATYTPSLSAFSDCLAFDDFLGGFRRYLGFPELASQDVLKAQKIIEQQYDVSIIGDSWKKIFVNLIEKNQKPAASENAEILIVLQLPQDLDVALPVILQAKRQAIPLLVYCKVDLLWEAPRVFAALKGNDIPYLLLDVMAIADDFAFPASAKSLITFSETNLRPHQFAHLITKKGNDAGLYTATTQHGLENIGLTYGDHVHPINEVTFAAQKIFLWGELDTLATNVRPLTLEKCISIGTTKTIKGYCGLDIPALEGVARPIVGFFENLHWHRYSDSYREFFVESLYAAASAHPSITFVVKPHPAGKWLTDRSGLRLTSMTNVIVANPDDERWEPFTAPDFMKYLDAVVTTPSTVALDAAGFGLPVSVISFDMRLDFYEPLPMIRNLSDLDEFLDMSTSRKDATRFEDISSRFVSRKIVNEGDVASAKIVAELKCAQDVQKAS